jgi:hypothetical protein
MHAVGGEGPIRGCHTERVHGIRSENGGGNRGEVGVDAHLSRERDHVLRPHLENELSEHNVDAPHRALKQRHVSAELALGVVADVPVSVGVGSGEVHARGSLEGLC